MIKNNKNKQTNSNSNKQSTEDSSHRQQVMTVIEIGQFGNFLSLSFFLPPFATFPHSNGIKKCVPSNFCWGKEVCTLKAFYRCFLY